MGYKGYEGDGLIPRRRPGWANRASRTARDFNSNINNLGKNRTSAWGNQASETALSFNTAIADESSKALGALASGNGTSTTSLDSSLISPVPNFDGAVPRRFGTRKSDDAYLTWQGMLNKNELGRSRDIEDQLVNRRSFEIAIEKALRGLPDKYNRIGMRNSGVFDRGVGEFERDTLRAGSELERQFMRRQQDFNLSDLLAGQQYYSAIGDDAELDALAQAAKQSNVNTNVLSGGSDANRATTKETLKNGQGFY